MIRGVLVGDDRLQEWISTRYPEIAKGLETSMARLVIKLARKIKEEKLSGQVLKNRTGTLRRSINPDVRTEGASIVGQVSTNVSYAAFHEYGFEGTENVRAHLRLIKKAFGKDLKSPVYANVGAYTRRVNYPEHSFMRTALAEMEAEIKETFQQSLAEVVKA